MKKDSLRISLSVLYGEFQESAGFLSESEIADVQDRLSQADRRFGPLAYSQFQDMAAILINVSFVYGSVCGI